MNMFMIKFTAFVTILGSTLGDQKLRKIEHFNGNELLTRYKNSPIYTNPEDFFCLIKFSSYFIDNTALISTLLPEFDRTHIVLAPSGFGKTLNLYMLKSFIEPEVSIEGKIIPTNESLNYRLFHHGEIMNAIILVKVRDGFSITADKHAMLQLGTKPVIFFTLVGSNEIESLQDVLTFVAYQLWVSIRQHEYLTLNNPDLDKIFQTYYPNSKHYKKRTATELTTVLPELANILHSCYNGTSPYILVDDYDTILNKVYAPSSLIEKKEKDRILQFFESFYNQLLAASTKKSGAFITGTLNWKLNHLFPKDVLYHDLAYNHGIVQYFGFDPPQVQQLLQELNMAKFYPAIMEHGYYDAGKKFIMKLKPAAVATALKSNFPQVTHRPQM